MSKKKQSTGCPCGLSALSGLLRPLYQWWGSCSHAESLMRSRYAAYTMNNADYLLASWHASTRPAELDLSREERFVKWMSLDVLSTQAGGKDDEAGVVEFVARYKVNGRAQRLHEISRFRKEDGHWFYVDGDAEEG
jgi:SEC-C motif-containing protein